MQAEGIAAEARPGEKSQFDVVVDGEVIFSKQRIGRFPEPGEIARVLEERP